MSCSQPLLHLRPEPLEFSEHLGVGRPLLSPPLYSTQLLICAQSLDTASQNGSTGKGTKAVFDGNNLYMKVPRGTDLKVPYLEVLNPYTKVLNRY